MVLFLFVLFLLACAVTAVVIIQRSLWQPYVESRCRDVAREAEELLEESLQDAHRLACEIRRKLQGRQQSLGEDGKEALGLAHLVFAVVAHREGKPREAEELLGQLRRLVEDPDRDSLVLKYHLNTSSSSAAAVECYLTVLGRGDHDLEPKTLRRVAKALRSACAPSPGLLGKDLSDRLRWNQHAQNVFPEEDWPTLNQAQAWHSLGEYDRARRILTHRLAQSPQSTAVHLQLARTLIAQGKKDEARLELAALEQSKQDPNDLLEVANLLACAGDLSRAIEFLRRMQAAAPNLRGDCLSLMGRLRLRARQATEALALLQQALSLGANDAVTLLTLAEVFSQQGDRVQALKYAQQAVPEGTTDARLQFALASALFNAGQWMQAANWFERCRQGGYRAAQAALLKARCCNRGGTPQTATDTLKETPLLDEQKTEAVFLRGVALYLSGSPREAIPFFVRVHNAAKLTKDRKLLNRVKANVCACYWRVGVKQVREGKFAEAAHTFEVLRKNYLPNQPHYTSVGKLLAECYLRSAIRVFRQDGDKALSQAVLALYKAAGIDPRPGIRALLGALSFRQGRPDDAARVFESVLETAASEELEFCWALARSRGASPVAGLEALRTIQKGGGSQAVRATLALAAHESERGRYGPAVGVISSVLRLPQAVRDPWYNEACCQAVLNAFRTGNEEWAIRLADAYFSSAAGASPQLLLGCLLADAGDYTRALPHLETALPRSGGPPAHDQALLRVYRQLAHQRCVQRDFPGVEEVAAKALRWKEDAELRQLHKLASAARNAGGAQNLDERILGLLDELHAGTSQPDASLTRSVIVAHHQRAWTLAASGQHGPARRYWGRAHSLWIERVQRRDVFWKDYIAAYNQGKEYSIDSTETGLEQNIQRRLAGLCIGLAGKALEDQTLPDAQFYWREARKVAQADVCRELFKEQVPTEPLLRGLESKKDQDYLLKVAQFLYDEIDQSEDSKQLLIGMSLKQVKNALKADRFTSCLEALDLAGRYDSFWADMARKLRKLGKHLVSRVVAESRPFIEAIVGQMPSSDVPDTLLLRVIQQYAAANEQIPGGVDASMIEGSMGKIVLGELQAMLKG